jgi:hypothetical protein
MVTAPTYGSASADTGVGPQPRNQIVVSGKPDVQYLNVETATSCYPGRLVKKGPTTTTSSFVPLEQQPSEF